MRCYFYCLLHFIFGSAIAKYLSSDASWLKVTEQFLHHMRHTKYSQTPESRHSFFIAVSGGVLKVAVNRYSLRYELLFTDFLGAKWGRHFIGVCICKELLLVHCNCNCSSSIGSTQTALCQGQNSLRLSTSCIWHIESSLHRRGHSNIAPCIESILHPLAIG